MIFLTTSNEAVRGSMESNNGFVMLAIVFALAIISLIYHKDEGLYLWYKNKVEPLIFQAQIFLIDHDEPCDCLPINKKKDKNGWYCVKCGVRA